MQKKDEKVSSTKRRNTVVKLKNRLLLVVPFIFAVWGFILFRESFIPVYMAISVSVAGSILAFFWYKHFRKQYHSSNGGSQMMTFIVTGASIGFWLLNAVNYYGPREPVRIVQLPILSKSSSSFKRNCTSPLATVRYDHVKKTLHFRCDELKIFHLTALVRLRIEKGMLGYYVYTDQRLIYNTPFIKD